MGKLTPTLRPTSALLVPSAASNTIRARCANPAGIVEDRVHSRSLCSSPALNTNGSTRDINHFLNRRQQSNFQHATLAFATLRACGVIYEVLRDQLIDHASITSREPSEPLFNQFPRRPFHAASQESDFGDVSGTPEAVRQSSQACRP